MILWVIGPNGSKDDKSHTIQALNDGSVKYSAIDVTEENVRMYGNTGIYNVARQCQNAG
jgi:hypothetical protein